MSVEKRNYNNDIYACIVRIRVFKCIPFTETVYNRCIFTFINIIYVILKWSVFFQCIIKIKNVIPTFIWLILLILHIEDDADTLHSSINSNIHELFEYEMLHFCSDLNGIRTNIKITVSYNNPKYRVQRPTAVVRRIRFDHT
jgi:hypothetical protein